ncbi:hypothetical protein RJT34_19981 [Clitoria ternatea]|uniref:Uncharacterized protein n=1 Tax=Clitoria ternatea TaxID=43366 RepID=A0AAN9ISH0_CLITE
MSELNYTLVYVTGIHSLKKLLSSLDSMVMIFFNAHEVPVVYVEKAYDSYKIKIEECVDLIMEELETRKLTNSFTLAYQSLVPLASVEELLAVYDSQRKELSPPVMVWE